MNEQKKIQNVYGWFFLAKRISEYLFVSVPDIMEMAAVDVFGWVMVVDADVQYKNYQINNAKY